VDPSVWLAERLPGVEAALEAALPVPSECPSRLLAAIRHLLFPGGKRLRPALALAGAESVGAPAERGLPMAVAVELVHTYSLIHDDLPCMDDDALRRGRPSVHVAFGEATAVLAGDALLAIAFGALAEAKTEPAHQVAALRELSRAAGAAGLVGGQHDDLAAGARDPGAIEGVHARKSGALFAAAIAGSACLCGAPEQALATLRRFGIQLGVAFQIADDLLDADADAGCSLVAAIGASAARDRAEALLAASLRSLEPLGAPADPLRALARLAVRRSA
jgi:geranylgeranyl pyrophosphate synthase